MNAQMTEQKKQVLLALASNAWKVAEGRISAREWRASAKRFAYRRGAKAIHLAHRLWNELVSVFHPHMSAGEMAEIVRRTYFC